MDEPFGPLDAQTRVILQAELLKLWQRARPTVLFVTHDLVEAIALSDRILVFTSNPGTVKREYTVDIPRPRDPFRIHETPGFGELHEALWADIRAEIERRDRRDGRGHRAATPGGPRRCWPAPRRPTARRTQRRNAARAVGGHRRRSARPSCCSGSSASATS